MPRGWLDALRQISLFAGAYLAYSVVRAFVAPDANLAFAHARELISLERTLHFFVEPSIQSWASGSHLVMVLASWLYVNAQTTILFGVLVYLYMRHNRNYYFVRNMLMIAMGLALIGYTVFPTAPPRFFPEWGFIDSVADFTGVPLNHTNSAVNGLTNLYAAVPSMHVACALLIGPTLSRLSRNRLARVLWLLYPLLITFVIIATANHFIVDALLGAVTAGASAWGASWLARVRPHAWRFAGLTPGLPASG